MICNTKYILLSVVFFILESQHVTSAFPAFQSMEGTLSFAIDIQPLFDNKGFGERADFDGFASSFLGDIQRKNKNLLIDYNRVTSSRYDNARANSQNVSLNNSAIGAIYMLVSVTNGPLKAPISIIYADGTKDMTTLDLPDWKDKNVDQMDRYQFLTYPTNDSTAALFSVPVFTNPAKIATQLLLPPKNASDYQTLHVFSMTAFHSNNDLVVASAEITGEWTDTNKQVISVKVHNVSPAWIKEVTLEITHPSLVMISQVVVEAVAPGHVQNIQVIVQKYGAKETVIVPLQLTYMYEDMKYAKVTDVLLTLQPTVDQTEATTASVQKHRPPTWLKQSKFGIFIHWGLFSVPAWAPVGKAYAEWYWWRMNHKDDAAFEYHRQHYGENFEYDDFLQMWNHSQYNPRTWLDLIDKSRAKYFVLTTKHHDGIALFNTSVTDRSTMRLLQPNRDFVKDLLTVSEASYPHLKRGLYFSLPEWYHPQYRDDSLGWYGPPMNPYTGQRVAYRGSKAIRSFVNEIQVPQFQELANNYSPDILWCDIGGINNSTVWQSEYFNNAMKEGRQVAVNDRCGEGSASDFTTIEYKAVKHTPTRFWEATRGMDPYSFGYNRETKPDEYASTYDLIKDLVDAVSKGGNFLLNIGPEASGHIPEAMSDRLLEIGQWLGPVHTSIFDSVPYWITSSEGDLRFTANTNGKSIYVFSFATTNVTSIRISTPLPTQHDITKVRLMNKPETQIKWVYDQEGNILIDYSTAQDIMIPVFEFITIN